MIDFNLTADDEAALDAAAKKTPAAYALLREALAKELALRHGLEQPIPLAFLDAEVGRRRNGHTQPVNEGQGMQLLLEDPEPWSEPVDGAVLLDELAATFQRFLGLPEHAAEALALWTVHAHAHEAADVSAVLAITSPVRGCGKTTLLDLLSALVPRPLPTSNVTSAALFRCIEKYHPTVLVDEGDSFMQGKDELLGILKSGHRRGGQVLRTAGDDYEARVFSTWAPKAIAAIGKLPDDALADRSIEVRMRRTTKEEEDRLERLRLDKLSDFEPLRRRAWRWAQDHLEQLRDTDPEVPDELRGRAADNWRFLLAIANLAGGDWPGRARSAALALSGGSTEDDSARIQLLFDLRQLFESTDRLFSEDIVRQLSQMEDRPWPEWRNGNPITKRQLAALLKPFGVRPQKIRLGNQSLQGYLKDDLEIAFASYLPSPEAEHPEHELRATADEPPEKRNTDTHSFGSRTAGNRSGVPFVPDVPDGESLLREERI